MYDKIYDVSITAKVNTKIFHFVNPCYLVTIQHYLATRNSDLQTFY